MQINLKRKKTWSYSYFLITNLPKTSLIGCWLDLQYFPQNVWVYSKPTNIFSFSHIFYKRDTLDMSATPLSSKRNVVKQDHRQPNQQQRCEAGNQKCSSGDSTSHVLGLTHCWNTWHTFSQLWLSSFFKTETPHRVWLLWTCEGNIWVSLVINISSLNTILYLKHEECVYCHMTFRDSW